MTPEARAIKLLGVTIHPVTAAELIAFAVERAAGGRKTLIPHVNAHGLNIAFETPWYRDFLNRADLVYCDGFGVLAAARVAGHTLDSSLRVACADFIADLAHACAARGLGLFLLGSRPGIAEEAARRLAAAAPGLRVEAHHGHFSKTGPENEAVLARLAAFRPDILLVGMGMPLQERWIEDNRERLAATVTMPIGACFDFHAGVTPRGPRVLTQHGFEWLVRLAVEPRRLGRRYLLGNPRFLWRVVRERLGV